MKIFFRSRPTSNPLRDEDVDVFRLREELITLINFPGERALFDGNYSIRFSDFPDNISKIRVLARPTREMSPRLQYLWYYPRSWSDVPTAFSEGHLSKHLALSSKRLFLTFPFESDYLLYRFSPNSSAPSYPLRPGIFRNSFFIHFFYSIFAVSILKFRPGILIQQFLLAFSASLIPFPFSIVRSDWGWTFFF